MALESEAIADIPTQHSTASDTDKIFLEKAGVGGGISKADFLGATSAEIGYLSGVTSSIQTQMNAKAESADVYTQVAADAKFSHTLISETVVSSDAVIDFTLDNSEFSNFEVRFDGVVPAVDADQFFMRFSNDAGSTFESGSTYYEYGYSSTAGNGVGVAGSALLPSATTAIGSAPGEGGVTGVLSIFSSGPPTSKTRVVGNYMAVNSAGQIASGSASGRINTAETNDAVRFMFSSGNLESGTISLYGVK